MRLRVQARLISDPGKAGRIARSLRRLTTRYRSGARPSEWWRPPAEPPRFGALWVFVLMPPEGGRLRDPEGLARRAAALLEERHGMILDWAAGWRKKGPKVWLLVRPWGHDRETWKRKRFKPDGGDLAALRLLRKRERAQERKQERKPERERGRS